MYAGAVIRLWGLDLCRRRHDVGRLQDAILGFFGTLFGAGGTWLRRWLGPLSDRTANLGDASVIISRGEAQPSNQALNRLRTKLGFDLTA